MNIHILYEHSLDEKPHGSSYIRLLYPYKHAEKKHLINISSGTNIDDLSADVYIIERMWKPDISLSKAEKVINLLRRHNKKIIYTLDDNLLDLQINRHGVIWPTIEQKNVVRLFAREADGIIVSTQPLKERFERFNKKTVVIPNSLDESLRLFKTQKRTNSKEIVFGYMGTSSHAQDLLMILPAIKEILLKHKNVRFEIVGVMEQQEVDFYFKGFNVKLLETNGNVEYPKFMKWMGQHLHWDFAIAPLEDNVFTNCKSDIKLLDYGIFKIPSVFSKMPVYEESIKHKSNGFLVENSNKEWFVALEEMILNEDMRRSLSSNVFNYVMENRTLNQLSSVWYNSLSTLIN